MKKNVVITLLLLSYALNSYAESEIYEVASSDEIVEEASLSAPSSYPAVVPPTDEDEAQLFDSSESDFGDEE